MLITLEEYKDYKGKNNPNKDNTIEPVVDSVNALIKAYCNRTFVEYYDTDKVVNFRIRKGQKTLILNEIPVVEIVSVLQNGVDITSSVSVHNDFGFLNYEFEENANVVVTYKGGTETTPADIKLAAYELVDFYINDEHKQSRSLGGSTIEYYQVTNEWPIHIQYILNAHRDV